MVILLCSSPRSGGNWLMQEVHDRGFPLGKEYLSKDYKDFAKDFSNKDFCIKIHPSEINFSKDVFLSVYNVLSSHSEIKILWLERENVIEQAESFAGARESGNWFDGSTRNIVKPNSFHLDQILKEQSFWQQQFKDEKYSYHKVVYEHLVKDTEAELDYIERFLRSDDE